MSVLAEVEVLAAIELNELLLVEDERVTREALAELLSKKGFRSRAAINGREAIEIAASGEVGVVLMDIALGEYDPDGIDAALTIQRTQPLASFIFVTAHIDDSMYILKLTEARQAGLRVAALLPKPVNPEQLVKLITKEKKKVEVRKSLSSAWKQGISPFDHLRSLSLWDKSLSQDLVEELSKELEGYDGLDLSKGRKPMATDEDEEIATLYAEIRGLIVRSAGDPGVKGEIDHLMERLRKLQEQEAKEMERRFRAQLPVQPERIWELLERAERLAE